MTNSAIIIDGKLIAERILEELKNEIKNIKNQFNLELKLAIVLVGNDPASNIYVQNKIKAAQKVGIYVQLLKFNSNISENILINIIRQLNDDRSISGVIIQFPLPDHIHKLKIIEILDYKKDVDGFHPINVGYLYSGYTNIGLVSCTALGCLELIKSCESNLIGKNVVIIGRSNIVGKPLAALLLQENCTVTICHSQTRNLQRITMMADIVVSAIGKREFLTTDYFNHNAVVIDVGINRIVSDNSTKLVGDVDFNNVKNKVKYITPVPGGVGPMTIAFLLKNTLKAAYSMI